MAEMKKCEACGKEFEARGDWQKVCIDCFKAGHAPKPESKAASKREFKTEAKATHKKDIDATMFRKAYDELKAEFADELDSVKEYLGGWTSTLVINRSK
jgi:ribosome-binding protein aMBF1 (putative translation factor)